MEELIIKKNEEAPAVVFIPEKGKFQIIGTSWLENPAPFFKRIMEWLREYFLDPLEETVFEINMEYFNTATAKHIINLLRYLKEQSNIHKIRIKWYYKADDIDLYSEIQRYIMLLNLDIIEPTEITSKTS